MSTESKWDAEHRPRAQVSVRRVLLEWSHADETPVMLDEIDAIVRRATIAHARRR